MIKSNKIRLFWWNEVKIQNKSKENYGDLLGAYLVEKISKKEVVWVRPKDFSILNHFQPIYATIGSILTHVNKKCVVWGSGIISKDYPIKKAKFLAVRGPQTRQFLVNQGYEVPKVYGDPALLLPDYFFPKVSKKYKIGVVPHYDDYAVVKKWFLSENNIVVLDLMTNNVEETTIRFLECEAIVSSSLHGIIVAHAYGIPAVWQRFSDKLFGDDIKFQDYFESVQIQPYTPEIINKELTYAQLEELLKSPNTLPKPEVITEIKTGLMEVCPFKE
ncbi:polysaccharide pyruvyl transferase family protein [Pseudotamlana agarivorans]|uniref:polysaccharide pyruvyl transferase family protein n=1 Tax=Pseudotamlana agarivorans TaxID=481183 RepID=UPI00082AF994|nr:polysaccharide pyruvyl transferase family protein [Tamlana agarivorans]